MGRGAAGAGEKPSSGSGELKASWAEYIAIAQVRLGMSRAEFGRTTPRLFCELLRQERLKARELHTLFALLRMDVINFSMARPKRAVRLEDLLPSGEEEAGRQAPDKPVRMTAKRRRRVETLVREVFKQLPGVKFTPGH